MRGSMTSQPEISEISSLPISKSVVAFLTFICCLLLANMSQMIILYNMMSDTNDKKYILIYILFPFICFIFLKIHDVNLCNQITHLFDFGYQSTPKMLNRNRQIVHALTFLGFPFLWITYALIQSHWVQSIELSAHQTFGEYMKHQTLNSILITLWTIIQFAQFILSVISLLYCIQHNIHQNAPKEKYHNLPFVKKFSFAMSNAFNNGTRNNRAGYMKKIELLERQVSGLQTELIKSKQDNIAANSQLSGDYADELQDRDQEYRALLSEKDLLKTEVENKKSLLNIKKSQCKQQLLSIKSLQQIREENIKTINDLKKAVVAARKETQKTQILLQIERRNVAKAQEYFENFT